MDSRFHGNDTIPGFYTASTPMGEMTTLFVISAKGIPTGDRSPAFKRDEVEKSDFCNSLKDGTRLQ